MLKRGEYTKIGNIVFISGVIDLSSLGSLSGTIDITGLPFTASAASGQAGGVTFTNGVTLNITAGYSITGDILNGSTTINIEIWDSANGTTDLTAAELSADGVLRFYGSYKTA